MLISCNAFRARAIWAFFSSLKLEEESERCKCTEVRKKLRTFFEKEILKRVIGRGFYVESVYHDTKTIHTGEIKKEKLKVVTNEG